MPKPLWAPWRLEYVQQADELEGCVFCSEASGELPAEASLLVRREAEAIAILNRFPYSSGHLLLAPVRHVGELGDLSEEEALALHRLSVAGVRALGDVYGPDGLGITDHVHLHVVPRWAGDTNFMPVLADVKVLPEHLLETRNRLRSAWPS
jgi:ATP adenylyltransferase